MCVCVVMCLYFCCVVDEMGGGATQVSARLQEFIVFIPLT